MINHTASKSKGLAWVLAAFLFGAFCALGLTPLAHIIPWRWEKKLAAVVDGGHSQSECRYDPRAQPLLQKIVARLYPIYPDDATFSIDVQIVRDPVVNAFAGLGGKISINSGLLEQAESADELAGILAHEIEHVRRRHIMEGALAHLFTAEGIHIIFGQASSASEWSAYFLNMDFSRAQETQADEGGLQRLHDAYIDNHGFRHFFERMEKAQSVPMFISDHPSNHQRFAMAEKFDNRDVRAILTSEEWFMLKNDCGNK